MAPRIVWLGAVAGGLSLVAAIGVFFLPLPPAVAVPLYLLFGGTFLAGVVIFGRLMVVE